MGPGAARLERGRVENQGSTGELNTQRFIIVFLTFEWQHSPLLLSRADMALNPARHPF